MSVDDDNDTAQLNEIDQYLSSPIEKTLAVAASKGESKNSSKEIVRFWLRNEFEYPGLSRMALDYLAIPATSVRSEQAFSSAKLMTTDLR